MLAFVMVLAWFYWSNWARYANAQAQIESRVARIDGILASSAEIDSRRDQARRSIDPWLHKGGGDSQNEILQRLREVVVASGATLISSQAAAVPAPSDAEQQLSRVKISATVSGEWSQLVQLGQVLQAQRPPYLVRSLNVQRDGQASGKTSQRARIILQLEAPMLKASEAKP
jgi:general secretion pathway protein M